MLKLIYIKRSLGAVMMKKKNVLLIIVGVLGLFLICYYFDFPLIKQWILNRQ